MNNKTDSVDPYAAAGVDIERGNALVCAIAPLARGTHSHLATHGAQLLAGIGGFAAALRLPSQYPNPVLTAATDGVGTKLELARAHGALECVGVDVVAMCVNDLLCAGTAPLFFLDYIATGALDNEQMLAVIRGIAAACDESQCALIGGETAEMPSVYGKGQFDIAGFAIGMGDESQLLKPDDVRAGDVLVALASSGAHSNGYSLIRKLLNEQPSLANMQCEQESVLSHLLKPTRLYPKAIKQLREKVRLHALAHITGGGLSENLPRVLPQHLQANVDFNRCGLPPLFAILKEAGNIDESQMRRIFNCGIGMVAVVDAGDVEDACETLTAAGETAWVIGEVVETAAAK